MSSSPREGGGEWVWGWGAQSQWNDGCTVAALQQPLKMNNSDRAADKESRSAQDGHHISSFILHLPGISAERAADHSYIYCV